MKLIPMTDFILELQDNELMSRIGILAVSYAKFLKQPLKLGMFVPCDEDGNVFEITICNKECERCDCMYAYNLIEQAKENVLFQDFEIALNNENEKVILGNYTCLKVSDLKNGTIEDLIKYVHIKLTKSAVKRIFS